MRKALYIHRIDRILTLFRAYLVIGFLWRRNKKITLLLHSLSCFNLSYFYLVFYRRELCNPCRKTRPVCMRPLLRSPSTSVRVSSTYTNNNNNNNNNSNNDGMLLRVIIFEHVIVKKGRPAVTASIIVTVTVYVAVLVPFSFSLLRFPSARLSHLCPINRTSPCVLWFHLGRKKKGTNPASGLVRRKTCEKQGSTGVSRAGTF